LDVGPSLLDARGSSIELKREHGPLATLDEETTLNLATSAQYNRYIG